MKKTIPLLLTLCFITASGFCQNTSLVDKKNPCKGCATANTDTCLPPDTINLYYDSCAKRIIKPFNDGLTSGKTYVFRLCNINSALYATKITAANVTRTPALPTVLSGLNGDNSTPKIEAAHGFYRGSLSEDYSKRVQNYYFFKRLKYDYDVLRLISDSTKSLLDYLVNHPANTDTITKRAQ